MLPLESYIIIGVLLITIGLESLLPQRRFKATKFKQTLRNLSIGVFNFIITSITIAGGYVFVFNNPRMESFFANREGASTLITGLVVFAVLDLYIYLWHRFVMHEWKFGYEFFHKFHHTEQYLNSTSAFRFHTLEVIASQLPRIALIWWLGIPEEYVLVYYIVFTVSNILQHSNIKVVPLIDMLISPILVTPRLHRVHHEKGRSKIVNFGTVFSIWDTVLGSREYRRDLTSLKFGE